MSESGGSHVDVERKEFQKLGQMAHTAAQQAWQRGEPFDFGQFAYGKPDYNWKYPFGPIWKVCWLGKVVPRKVAFCPWYCLTITIVIGI